MLNATLLAQHLMIQQVKSPALGFGYSMIKFGPLDKSFIDANEVVTETESCCSSEDDSDAHPMEDS